MTTPPHSIAYVLLASFLGSFGAVFLKAGAGRLHRNLRTLFLNWRLAFGVGMFLVSSYFFVLGLREGELSVLYPMIALGYLWTMLWSRWFFGEPITRRKMIGIGIILLGVTLLNLSNR